MVEKPAESGAERPAGDQASRPGSGQSSLPLAGLLTSPNPIPALHLYWFQEHRTGSVREYATTNPVRLNPYPAGQSVCLVFPQGRPYAVARLREAGAANQALPPMEPQELGLLASAVKVQA